MQINKINNVSFGAVNIDAAKSLLLTRLSNPARYVEYKDFVASQSRKKYDIVLKTGREHCLSAIVYDKDGQVILTKKENVFRGIFNLSPVKFLSNIAKTVEKKL